MIWNKMKNMHYSLASMHRFQTVSTVQNMNPFNRFFSSSEIVLLKKHPVFFRTNEMTCHVMQSLRAKKMINDKDQFMLLRPFFQGFLNVKEHVPRAFF